ncbi:Aminodeoxychorismate lyase [Pseudoalteromonas holothuriae]|uniref:Aminodeoxychorismate lyase n=1 Tax=Pseudoalteromonas holothuriae TaxID=2963714 RepID=A0A9W4QXT8_9GAMM|nr:MULTISPECIES: aminodeoxychorismate lyase [unclassified Pseudoalteromonas]CAH9055266.1 Aminodeoxychorismate lyase [Pseudoalteromonas sp. CIP111951]CAH9057962.1 Aminodeoxychorismate lyase [Pseudoalteromonas sp. CIP111854]
MEIIEAHSVSDYDRGLLYGDGFFTTAQVQGGQILLWDRHLNRLKECQQRLQFPSLDWQTLNERCNVESQKLEYGVLKVIITRGVGGRGYLPPKQAHPHVILQTSHYPTHYPELLQRGLALQYSAIQLGHQPLLAGLKTLNRLEQVLIKQDAEKYSCDDVLVCDINSDVVETSVGNLIAVKAGRAFTPILNKCGISGVYLQHLAKHNKIEQRRIKVEEILEMDALFVCNSLLGCAFVRSLGTNEFDLSLAKLLQTQLESGML